MARRSLSESFRNDPQLQQYCLEGVSPTGITLRVGSYGSVVEVKYRHASCAAKGMHEHLLHSAGTGVRDIINTFRRECQLMAGLRHPNIIQFLGLCYLEGSELPLLVMEELTMSIHTLLEDNLDIPLLVKISILTDTCSGLVYLHDRPSPIVHRDLTASNVLLTSSLTAKITDLGNSRIVARGQIVQTLSMYSGTTVYMPPEVFSGDHKYGPSLDVFSFGHLLLYVLTQLFPGRLLPPTYVDPNQRGRLMARSEVERRGVYMRQLEQQYNRSYPVLVQLVTQCLVNTPETRPTSPQLLRRLQAGKSALDKTHGGKSGRLMNITAVLEVNKFGQLHLDKTCGGKLERLIDDSAVLEVNEIANVKKQITNLQVSEFQQETDIGELAERNEKLIQKQNELESSILKTSAGKNLLETVINQVLDENDKVKTENNHLKTTNNLVEENNKQLKAENSQLKAEVNKLKAENDKLHSEMGHYQENMHALQMEIKRLNKELKKKDVVSNPSVNNANTVAKHTSRLVSEPSPTATPLPVTIVSPTNSTSTLTSTQVESKFTSTSQTTSGYSKPKHLSVDSINTPTPRPHSPIRSFKSRAITLQPSTQTSALAFKAISSTSAPMSTSKLVSLIKK